MTFEWAITGSCSSSHCGHILSTYCMGGSTQSLCSSSTMYWPPVFVRLLCPILPCNLSCSCTKNIYIEALFIFFQKCHSSNAESVRKYLLGHVQSAWHSRTSGVHWPLRLVNSLIGSRFSRILCFDYVWIYFTVQHIYSHCFDIDVDENACTFFVLFFRHCIFFDRSKMEWIVD